MLNQTSTYINDLKYQDHVYSSFHKEYIYDWTPQPGVLRLIIHKLMNYNSCFVRVTMKTYFGYYIQWDDL